jgi:predicted naringenin-chalcone synthase
MELYRREAPRLACRAAERCLAGVEGFAREAVTHLIVVSCTGFFAPGLDAHLVGALELRPDVHRLTVGFMGCHAAFNALRAADAICRANDDAHVLIVCVELCTIHFQRDPTLNDIVANSLFSDGAAAFLITRRPARGVLELLDSTSRLDTTSADQMSWTITDTGFRMMLGSEVPRTLMERVGPFVDELLGRGGWRRADVGFWAIHHGGRRIVEVVRDRLALSDAEAAPSFEVLAEHGNMSSPTIAFVLDRALRRRPDPGTLGVALAFGPGLTLESALLRVA